MTDAKEVNEFHQKDDLDSSHRAHHHTLGFGPNQASPGNHTHDGTTSPAIDTGVMTITSVDNTIEPIGPDVNGNVDLSSNLQTAVVSAVTTGSGDFSDITLPFVPLDFGPALDVTLNGVAQYENWLVNPSTGVFTLYDPDLELHPNDVVTVAYKHYGVTF